jgi:hypothetical protein
MAFDPERLSLAGARLEAYVVGVSGWIPDSDSVIENPLVQALLVQEGKELYEHLTSIRESRCSNCGDTATVVRLDLDGRDRRYYCESCRRFA